jgi:hypothetical protein
MPFYTALIAALGAFLFWYVFLRRPPQGNGGQNTQQGYPDPASQRSIPQQPASPVTLVNDPVSATATFLIALARAENQLDSETETLIKKDISEIMGVTRVDELYSFALNAAEQVTDPSNLMIRFGGLWVNNLDMPQRQDVYDMASRVANLHGAPSDLQLASLKQLAGRLGLPGA